MAHGGRLSRDPPDPRDDRRDEQDELVRHSSPSTGLTLHRGTGATSSTASPRRHRPAGCGCRQRRMRVYLVLLEGRTGAVPLFLQVKQAGNQSTRAHTRPSRYDNHGARVVHGKRLLPSPHRHLRGWSHLRGTTTTSPSFRDMKIIPSIELVGPRLVEFATVRRVAGPGPRPYGAIPSH